MIALAKIPTYPLEITEPTIAFLLHRDLFTKSILTAKSRAEKTVRHPVIGLIF